jgi:hypothetical protein
MLWLWRTEAPTSSTPQVIASASCEEFFCGRSSASPLQQQHWKKKKKQNEIVLDFGCSCSTQPLDLLLYFLLAILVH